MNNLFIVLLLLTPLAFLVGMVKPTVYHKASKRELSRKQLSKYFGTIFIVLFVLVGATSPSSGKEGVRQEEVKELEVITEQESSQPDLYSVIRVIDGDTLEVSIDDKTEDVRLIGVDTPETVDPRKSVECFGKEASKKAVETLSGKKIKLESDSSQGDRDKYSRLLRYVLLDDGTDFNKLMISEGYAYEYTYNLPYKYQQEYKEAQREAQENKRGLWADGVCETPSDNQSTTSASAQPVPSTPAPYTPNPISTSPAPTQTSTPPSSGVVKKSTTGICHAPGTTYYNRTTNYTSYNSVEACLASGGRLPKR